ncbi:phytanoyl-CoA dioxygenase family protein [Pseudomonas sp. CGJS7]|uniref:phytanoyl-CoA dioxygenase family protein n=1 Tax=Pseudomonas sp. CGJS7 TaxID=3109348 RepID=UPI00300A1D9A
MLSDAQKRQFADDGFVVIDPQIDHATLDGVIERVGNGLLVPDGKEIPRILDAWKLDPGVRDIALAPAVQTILAELYGRKTRAFQTLNFRVGTQQPVHSDTIHFNSAPNGYMCGVWVAMEDIDQDNGAVVYYPGSHKLPEVTMPQVFAEPDLGARRAPPPHAPWSWMSLKWRLAGHGPIVATAANYPLYEEYIARMVERLQLKPALATIRKGQAFVWAANLLHGGSPRHDPSRTRHSQVSHYYFEGTRYHRPVLNEDGKMRYFKPDWIV